LGLGTRGTRRGEDQRSREPRAPSPESRISLPGSRFPYETTVRRDRRATDVSQIRNIGIVGQGGGGKTSLADAILFAAGATTRLGSVDDGTSSFDFEPEETRRKLSLTTAFHHAPWRKHEITVVDTPGYINFLTDGLNCMRACTTAVFVLEPTSGGIKVEAERVWSRAEQLKLPCVGFVTKMDRENASFDAVLADAAAILQAKPIPVQLPIGSAESFRGVIDLIAMRALVTQPNGQSTEEPIPADLTDAAKAAREKLMEAAAETDDALVEQYLESGELTTEQLTEALRNAVREDPDVILVGELRDLESISLALTAAETGIQVFATLHTAGACKTIDRVINVFPARRQEQIRAMLAESLRMIVSQRLVRSVEGGKRLAVAEILVNTHAAAAMIRAGNSHKLESVIQAGGSLGMQSFDAVLRDLVRRKLVDEEEARTHTFDPAQADAAPRRAA
jgi:small GTP-binding protein